MNTDEIFDAVIVGAGVVGCAVARRLTLDGARVLVLEKGKDILDGASKGNSAILHTGFDAPEDSLELQCIKSGYEEFLTLRESLNLPTLKSGAIVAAWSAADVDRLDSIVSQAQTNGIQGVEQIEVADILQREPALSDQVKGGVWVPGESLIDPWTTPFSYLRQALDNGARLQCAAELTQAQFDGETWELSTTSGSVTCRFVINCAGLYGDRVDAILRGETRFEIRPRKGQFVVFDKAASAHLGSILLPVPSATTKGIVICRTIFGNLLVGPTAEEQLDRDDASVDHETLLMLKNTAIEKIPALANELVTATYAGIRPATEFKDYCMQLDPLKRLITVGGIRSTGLTAALGIARKTAELFFSTFSPAAREDLQPADPVVCRPVEFSLSEYHDRRWSEPGNGEIVCHCELVTRREVEDALEGDIPVKSHGGLKRRTRAGMGRCQGFYCSATITNLTEHRFDDSEQNSAVNP